MATAALVLFVLMAIVEGWSYTTYHETRFLPALSGVLTGAGLACLTLAVT